tara:strand:+ start:1439 stop:1768 length:330 start_codon:yes stop_codon:yes gene_type:complete
MTEDVSVTERLMTTLISKMESMDHDLQSLKHENAMLRKAIRDPTSMLRKAGFVSTMTPLTDDVEVDAFRAADDAIIKGHDNFSNSEIHQMSWEEIHEMAEQAKSTEVTA